MCHDEEVHDSTMCRVRTGHEMIVFYAVWENLLVWENTNDTAKLTSQPGRTFFSRVAR